MNLTAIIDRVRDTCTAFQKVGGAAELDSALKAAPVTPAAYVIEEASQAKPNDLMGVVRQDVEVNFSVMVAVGNSSDATGAAGLSALQSLRDALWTALAGWQPADTIKPIEYIDGALLEFQPGLMWWAERFSVTHEKRQP